MKAWWGGRGKTSSPSSLRQHSEGRCTGSREAARSARLPSTRDAPGQDTWPSRLSVPTRPMRRPCQVPWKRAHMPLRSFPALPLLNFSAQNQVPIPWRALTAGSTPQTHSLPAGLQNLSWNHADGVLTSLTHPFTHSFTIQSEGTKPSPARIIHNPSGK